MDSPPFSACFSYWTLGGVSAGFGDFVAGDNGLDDVWGSGEGVEDSGTGVGVEGRGVGVEGRGVGVVVLGRVEGETCFLLQLLML